MNKIWLIIQREYLTRVRNKTFVITTILVPLLFAVTHSRFHLLVDERERKLKSRCNRQR